MTEKNHSYIFLKNLLELLPEVPADSILSRSLYKDGRIRSDWRVLLNGRDVSYGGLDQAISPGDTVSIFPPGR